MSQPKKGLTEEVDTMKGISFNEAMTVVAAAIVLCTIFGTYGYWWLVMR